MTVIKPQPCTEAQSATLDRVEGALENVEVVAEPAIGGGIDLVFAGDSPDGLAVGHIQPSGEIHWIVGSL